MKSGLEKFLPNGQKSYQQKAEDIFDLFESKEYVEQEEARLKLLKQPPKFVSSSTTKVPERTSEWLRLHLQDEQPIIIDDKFEGKIKSLRQDRLQNLYLSNQLSQIDGEKQLLKPRLLKKTRDLINQTNQSPSRTGDSPQKKGQFRSSNRLSQRSQKCKLDQQDQEDIEEMRLDDLPQDIEEIEKLKEENIIVKYKGGRHVNGIDQNQQPQGERIHQRQISCNQEFEDLEFEEKLKRVVDDDYFQEISYNITYNDSIAPKNMVSPLADMSSTSRDFLIQKETTKTKLVDKCIEMLQLEDILINQKDISLKDISNIISERINSNQLRLLFTNEGIVDLAKKVYSNSDEYSKNKFFSKLDQKLIFEDVPYLNQVSQRYHYFLKITKIKSLKQVDEIKRLKNQAAVSGLQDFACEANQFDIVEETKQDIDWALEDFYFLKQAKENVNQIPTHFDGITQLQKAVNNRFEDSLFEVLRIFLGVSKEDYYEKQTVSYGDLMDQLSVIIKNPEVLQGQKINGHKKLNVMHTFLSEFLSIVEREEKVMEKIKQIHHNIQVQNEEREKEFKKPSYLKDYENGKIKNRKINQNKIFSTINKFKKESKLQSFKF